MKLKSLLIYMNSVRFRKLFKRCCKKNVDEVDSILEDINDLQLFANPKKKEKLNIF